METSCRTGECRCPVQSGCDVWTGKGVIKDYVYAHMWGNLAASNGDEGGGKLRDIVVKLMTPSQLEKAQDLACECVRKKYKGC